MNQNELKSLKTVAAKIRLGALEAVHAAASGHPGGSLSIAEILAYLYFKEIALKIRADTDRWSF